VDSRAAPDHADRKIDELLWRPQDAARVSWWFPACKRKTAAQFTSELQAVKASSTADASRHGPRTSETSGSILRRGPQKNSTSVGGEESRPPGTGPSALQAARLYRRALPVAGRKVAAWRARMLTERLQVWAGSVPRHSACCQNASARRRGQPLEIWRSSGNRGGQLRHTLNLGMVSAIPCVDRSFLPACYSPESTTTR